MHFQPAGLAIALLVVGCVVTQRSGPGPALALPFHVIAHRGASAYAPENTLPAFQKARELGVPDVELDVQLSRDGVVVLFHDRTLDDKTDLSGRVDQHDASALLRADIGSWFDATHPGAERSFAGTPLVTLDQVFERFDRAFHYHVEIKSLERSLPQRILEIARARNLSERVTISSFQLEPLRRARALDGSVRIAWLLDEPSESRIEQAAREHFQMIGVSAARLDEKLVRHARHAGLEIRAWRVKTPEDMEHVIRVGANGMTIDWPDRLLRRLAEIRQARASHAP